MHPGNNEDKKNHLKRH